MDPYSYLIHTFLDVSFQTPSVSVILSIVLAFFLLLLSAFASGSEIAFFSLSPTDLSELSAMKSEKDSRISALREDSERTLATILITNNVVNVTIVMILGNAIGHVIHFGDNAYWLQLFITTVVLTFLLLLFGEIMPKVYARQNALWFCRMAVDGLMTLRKIFWWPSNILLGSGSLAEKVVRKENVSLSVDDLEQALQLTDNNEIREEKSILQGIIRFGDETAKEIMTSRQDIVDIDIKSSFTTVIQSIVENNYSRIPISQNGTDHITGILYIKDLLPHLGKPASFRWQSLVRPAYFVPETKKIDDLLREFQENKMHIAIVVDEFGGTSGLVTLEDILEEIVGEIDDEYDETEHLYTKLNYNTFVFEGKTLLSDFYKIVGVDSDVFDEVVGEADTLAGLLLEIKGDFPTMHEVIEYKPFSFEIVAIDGRRISRVKVKRC